MAGARPPDAAAARRFCALPRDLQGSAGRTREGPCGGCGRAGGSAGANAHGPPPVAAFAAARAHGRAFAAFLCTAAAGVRSSGRGRARRRDGLALPHPTSHGRAFAAFLCTAAAACAVPAAAVRGGGTGWRFPTPHPMAARSHRSCARPPRACAAEGRAGASSPHIPWPRVRIVSVHDCRRRTLFRPRPCGGCGTGRRFPTPHPMAARSRRFCARLPQAYAVPAARSRRSNSYRAQGGFAPTAAVRRRRAPLRSRSAPRAGRGPRGRSGRRPRSAGRWGGAGRASR